MASLFLLLGCNLSYIVDLFAALHELASANARTLLKLASSVRALLKPYGHTLSGTMIKFLPLDFLIVSHRIPWQNENTVYRLQISAFALEIFKFEKWVKYANDMTDDVIHSTQYYMSQEPITDWVYK